MRPARNPIPVPVASFPDNVRRHGRVKCQLVSCGLGEVLDISLSGLRVAYRKSIFKSPPKFETGKVLPLTVEGLSGPFEVFARVMWVSRKSATCFELGLQFEDLLPETRQQLSALARASAVNEVLGPGIKEAQCQNRLEPLE